MKAKLPNCIAPIPSEKLSPKTPMPEITALVAVVGIVFLLSASAYGVLEVLAVWAWQRRRRMGDKRRPPPVSLLKPLCGPEPSLYENLRTFCRQNFPEYQIIFGVQDGHDPALAVVRRLQQEFPSLAIDVVVNSRQHGSNCKVSNLINMVAHARHDVLVMADSDAFVCPEYLGIVTAPLRDESVGLVTCLYRAVPTRVIFSRLGAMYINEWYMPSVLLAWLFGHQGYVSGQTLCIRRETLDAIGGLERIANHLADDHQLGERVHALGKRVVLSHYVPSAECHEPSFASLIGHEVRWMRTLHVLQPRCFLFLFFSFSLPLALVGLMLAGTVQLLAPLAWALFAATTCTRLALHFAHRVHGRRLVVADLWLLPLRDLLLCWVWCKSLLTSRVIWRGNEFDVDAEGVMHRLS